MAEAICLEAEFDTDMREILEKERELKLCSTRFRRMLDEYGGLQSAHRLLKNNNLPPMFEYLRSEERLNLTMEYYVVLEKYRPCFSDEEREIADFRLKYGF